MLFQLSQHASDDMYDMDDIAIIRPALASEPKCPGSGAAPWLAPPADPSATASPPPGVVDVSQWAPSAVAGFGVRRRCAKAEAGLRLGAPAAVPGEGACGYRRCRRPLLPSSRTQFFGQTLVQVCVCQYVAVAQSATSPFVTRVTRTDTPIRLFAHNTNSVFM